MVRTAQTASSSADAGRRARREPGDARALPGSSSRNRDRRPDDPTADDTSAIDQALDLVLRHALF
jgi:hypothetical protein